MDFRIMKGLATRAQSVPSASNFTGVSIILESSMRIGDGAGTSIISCSLEFSARLLLQASSLISGPFSRAIISCSLAGDDTAARVHRSQFYQLPKVILSKEFLDNLGHSGQFFHKSSSNEIMVNWFDPPTRGYTYKSYPKSSSGKIITMFWNVRLTLFKDEQITRVGPWCRLHNSLLFLL
ncbi:uncharacterized protein LOC104425344 isoform X1 [Eucalyptus grandis]|uniref:uncharacterized protein LOC104425344 isoform X1 n=1 Tax=Eucalyptus grandis TaxID=71139 RepID=UPI00192F020C|nr:uncharacterized protein LOC104425344 isoform X1 [Eucalyptus grandis]XP_039167567.1 uncharacterized protein LOC104425344 isoform X1 [Eucalyptus grandis]